MKTILATLSLAAASVLGFASTADAAPVHSAAARGVFHGDFGVGISTGGYAQSSGYYTTEYRWVPTTALAGYDAFNRPVYTTQYVQQAFQVWVPTASYTAPSFGFSNFGGGHSTFGGGHSNFGRGYSPARSFLGFGLGRQSGHHSGRGIRGGGGHRAGRGHRGR